MLVILGDRAGRRRRHSVAGRRASAARSRSSDGCRATSTSSAATGPSTSADDVDRPRASCSTLRPGAPLPPMRTATRDDPPPLRRAGDRGCRRGLAVRGRVGRRPPWVLRPMRIALADGVRHVEVGVGRRGDGASTRPPAGRSSACRGLASCAWCPSGVGLTSSGAARGSCPASGSRCGAVPCGSGTRDYIGDAGDMAAGRRAAPGERGCRWRSTSPAPSAARPPSGGRRTLCGRSRWWRAPTPCSSRAAPPGGPYHVVASNQDQNFAGLGHRGLAGARGGADDGRAGADVAAGACSPRSTTRTRAASPRRPRASCFRDGVPPSQGVSRRVLHGVAELTWTVTLPLTVIGERFAVAGSRWVR